MSAWVITTTDAACVTLARPNASSSHRTSAAVRCAASCCCAVDADGTAYQGSASLFEPPGTLTVTKTTPCRSHSTFSTYCRSVGCCGDGTCACDSTCSAPEPSVRPACAKKTCRISARLLTGLPLA